MVEEVWCFPRRKALNLCAFIFLYDLFLSAGNYGFPMSENTFNKLFCWTDSLYWRICLSGPSLRVSSGLVPPHCYYLQFQASSD